MASRTVNGTGTGTGTRCPRCGSGSVPILYGLPSSDAFEAAKRGELVLGGCTRWDDDDEPTRACRGIDCGLEF